MPDPASGRVGQADVELSTAPGSSPRSTQTWRPVTSVSRASRTYRSRAALVSNRGTSGARGERSRSSAPRLARRCVRAVLRFAVLRRHTLTPYLDSVRRRLAL